MYQLSIADYLEETREIPLSQGKVAIVSASDCDYLRQWRWCALFRKCDHRWYAVRTDHNKAMIYMHRFIMDPPQSMLVDHADNNGLNNTRANLRICTHAQNLRNRKKRYDSVSHFKGITPSSSKWCAYIYVDKRNIYLGTFPTELDAALAYDAAARKHFGEFARTNF